MSASEPLKIDLTERFDHLSKSPIVEAVIGITARPSIVLEEATLMERLKTKIPDYPKREATKSLLHQIRFEKATPEHYSEEDWHGINCTSGDGKQIARFERDGFVFSRLSPYEDWQHFSSEALRLWSIYCEIAKPLEIQRLGVRFINRIDILPGATSMAEVLNFPPKSPIAEKTPMFGFLHQDTFSVPELELALQLIKTIQPTQGDGTKQFALIVDFDVFTTTPFEFRENTVRDRLQKITWLKNKAFFGTFKPEILKSFK
jgi:uncharacterized protein (TIGR04255 family)